MHCGFVVPVVLVRCALLHRWREDLLDQRLFARRWLSRAFFRSGSHRALGSTRLACVAHDRMPLPQLR